MDLSDVGAPTSSNLQTYCDTHFTNGYKKPSFELYNLQNGAYVKVGEVTQLTYLETGTIIYPGGSTTKPESTSVSIPMSHN